MLKRVLVYGMTDNPGGIETYLINTMKELNKQDIKLDFLCDFPQIAYKEDIENNGSKVYFIPAITFYSAFCRCLSASAPIFWCGRPKNSAG